MRHPSSSHGGQPITTVVCFWWVGRERERRKNTSGHYGQLPCHTQKCWRFKSNWSAQIKHMTSAYEVRILIRLWLATVASARAIMHKTSLGFAATLVARNNHCRVWSSLLAPTTQHPDELARRYLSMYAKGVRCSSGDAFCYDRPAETMHKLHKEHVKVASQVKLHSLCVTCQCLT